MMKITNRHENHQFNQPAQSHFFLKKEFLVSVGKAARVELILHVCELRVVNHGDRATLYRNKSFFFEI
jgi:hypothetical protein